MSINAFVAAGYYDPNASNGAERRELLEHLLRLGYTVDQICAAAAGETDESFFRVPNLLAHPETHSVSATDVADRVGSSPEEVAEMLSTVGLPVTSVDADEITEEFVDYFRVYQFACATYGAARTLGMVRVIGASVAAMTEAARELVLAPLRDNHATELEIAQANELSIAAWNETANLVGYVMRAHAGRDRWFVNDLLRGDIVVAVSFVDLIGSTDWATAAGTDASAALARFEDTATRLAIAGDARVIKFIGDEAMIVGPDAARVAEVAARLCAAVAGDHDLPAARGAVGWGVVTARGGDYFGDIVNLVARATKEAPANGIVVTSEVASRLARSRWQISPLRAVSLRGIPGSVELFDAALDQSAGEVSE